MLIAVRVKVLPSVTVCAAFNSWQQSRVSALTSAKCEAVSVAVTVPSVIAEMMTLRPVDAPFSGAPHVGGVLLPSEYVPASA